LKEGEAMACVFDISGEFAMFRKSYTTTSSISNPFPPPTAIAGIIGAILGFDHGSSKTGYNAEYWEKMKDTAIAVKINRPVKWFRTGINFLNTKTGKLGEHTQIKHQFVRNPSYRIFVSGPLEKELENKIQKNEFHFLPYLGVAYCMAEVKYLGSFPVKENNGEKSVDSVIPTGDTIPKIDIVKTKNLNQTLIPYQMDINRKLLKTVNVLYKMEGGKIYLDPSDTTEVKKVGEDTVAWFAAWQ